MYSRKLHGRTMDGKSCDSLNGSKFLFDLGKFFFIFETYKPTEKFVTVFSSAV